MTLNEWLAFVAIWIAVGLPVGPNAVTCVTASVSHGPGRGLWVALGITLASVAHSLVAAFGFGVLLLAYAEVFYLMKWLGVAYLLWMGVALWRAPVRELRGSAKIPAGRTHLLRRGFLVSMSNPKAALMYLAVFTQSIAPEQPLAPQLAILMPTASGIVLIIYCGWVILGAPLGRLLTSVKRLRLFNRAAAGFYLFSASAVALADPRRGVT